LRRAVYAPERWRPAGWLGGVSPPRVTGVLLRGHVRWVLCRGVDYRCVCRHSSAAAEHFHRHASVVDRAEAEALQRIVELDELVRGERQLRFRGDFRIGRDGGDFDRYRTAV